MRAKYLATNKDYAIKILDKAHLRRHGKLNTVLAEKQALVKLGAGQSHPGIIRLYWAFQDEWSLRECGSLRCGPNRLSSRIDFVLDLATNGEMQSRISQLGSLSTQCTQYYTAQIADALDYMHSVGVIHRFVPLALAQIRLISTICRDLKPENLLLDDAFRIKVTDFGTAKCLDSEG
jgi:3-phosphoinositide dependent protein kinase-1